MPCRQRFGFWALTAGTKMFVMSSARTRQRSRQAGKGTREEAVTLGCCLGPGRASFLGAYWELLPEKVLTGRKLAAWTLTKLLSQSGSLRKRLC